MDQTTETRRFLARPGHSALYGKLRELLETTDKHILTDEEINAAVGESCRVRHKGYGTLLRVMRAIKTSGVCWTREPGAACIQRRDSKYIVGTSDKAIRSVRRKVKSAAQTFACAKLDELEPDSKRKLLASQAIVGALMLTVSSATQKKIEARQSEAVADASAVFKLLSR